MGGSQLRIEFFDLRNRVTVDADDHYPVVHSRLFYYPEHFFLEV